MEKIYEIQNLANAMGWIEILPQNNDKMISFTKEEDKTIRINVYFKAMTVTVQSRKKFGEIISKKNVSIGELEEIFQNPGL